jgi:hypothetical protein
MATAGASPKTLVFTWVMESVIMLLIEVGKAMTLILSV